MAWRIPRFSKESRSALIASICEAIPGNREGTTTERITFPRTFSATGLDEQTVRQFQFPSCATFDLYIRSYFLSCGRVLPILHAPTFDPNRTDPALLLAIVTTGSRTTLRDGWQRSSTDLFDITNLVLSASALYNRMTRRSLSFLQASLLHNLSGYAAGTVEGLARSQDSRLQVLNVRAIYCLEFQYH